MNRPRDSCTPRAYVRDTLCKSLELQFGHFMEPGVSITPVTIPEHSKVWWRTETLVGLASMAVAFVSGLRRN
jgi:hypothetical protein